MYEIILFIHVMAFIVNISAVVVADVCSLWWAFGRTARLNAQFLAQLHRYLYYGMAASILSGVILVFPLIFYMIKEPVFQVKLMAITALIINSVLIGKHLHLPAEFSFKELPKKQKGKLLLSGFVSALAWGTVAICGFLLPV